MNAMRLRHSHQTHLHLIIALGTAALVGSLGLTGCGEAAPGRAPAGPATPGPGGAADNPDDAGGGQGGARCTSDVGCAAGFACLDEVCVLADPGDLADGSQCNTDPDCAGGGTCDGQQADGSGDPCDPVEESGCLLTCTPPVVPCRIVVSCDSGQHWDQDSCSCMDDLPGCTADSDCHGILPQVCHACSDGTTACAHWALPGRSMPDLHLQRSDSLKRPGALDRGHGGRTLK
jgi:hypothetical protein